MDKFSGLKRLGAIFTLCAATAISGWSQTLTTLVGFRGYPVNGANPMAGVIKGADGNFYGTTTGGGSYGFGTVFEVTPAGVLTTIYSFGKTTSDGAHPNTGLCQGSDGNFYGTTSSNGFPGYGTIFEVTPAGVLTTLYNFPQPWIASNLVQGSDGNFYGTTQLGANQYGTVFRITTAGVYTTLFTFNYDANGANPMGGLVLASDGNLYGTTSAAGANLYGGTIFKINSAGTLTTIYSFSRNGGAFPFGSLTVGTDGNFYGITTGGGALQDGTIFRITPGGTLTTLYSFGPQIGNGESPNSTLVEGPDGSFYGTTMGTGTVFRMSPGGTVTTLYSFCSQGSCLDGSNPSGVALGNDGNLYGTTLNSGPYADGTFFLLTLPTVSSYTCTNTTPPVITFIDSASAYGGYSYFASGSWLEIKGTNLADPNDPRLSAAVNPGQWTSADFNGVNAPTSLDGISVSINGKPAYVWYLSPGQLNVQAPEDSTIGNVAITVTNCKATSPSFTFTRRALAPGFLAPANYTANGTQYLVAFFVSDNAYVLNTSTGAAFGINSRPAKPGDQIYTYGIGFGDVTPSTLPGVIAPSSALVNPVTLSFGTTPATISYQGLTPGSVGLYQFNLTVPSTLANGDYQIVAAQGGTTVPQTMYLTVHN